MHILLDLQGCQTESRFRGIGRYSLELALGICRNANGHDITILLNDHLPETVDYLTDQFNCFIPKVRLITFSVPKHLSWKNPNNSWRRNAAELVRSYFIGELRPDIVHISSLFEGAEECDATSSTLTEHSGIPTVVTLYDLIPLADPTHYLSTEWVRAWYMNKIDHLKHADLLLSISEYSRLEAINLLGISVDRIVNISSAHSHIFQPQLLDEYKKKSLLAEFGIASLYIMYNGALESRKNLNGLIRAYSMLSVELQAQYQLVFVGKVSETDRVQIKNSAKQLGIEQRLILTGHVSDKELVGLFSYCSLFVFPSLYEGFGLPALEAMACGAPTIGSNVTSIPEVIGWEDALFNPLDSHDIAEKITRALIDITYRRSLCQHALTQSSKFSWDICAKNAIAAFERLHGRNPLPKINTWAFAAFSRKTIYARLIGSIADIPRRPIAPTDSDLRATAKCISENRAKIDQLARLHALPSKINWRIEGPFDSSYSLALLNRETALALDALGHQVALYSTEGNGDFLPNNDFLAANPSLARLHSNGSLILPSTADITSRNMYPPRVSDMTSQMNMIHHFAWEESGFPMDWVNHFNDHLQGITTISQHVEKILIDNGVVIPMEISGCGVDHWERVDADSLYMVGGRSFRFLHVSSCFPRKGVDLLLKAYGDAFTIADDVTLIIKTFPNPHNTVRSEVLAHQEFNNNFPDVVIIEDDLSDAQLKSIYQQCHAMVAPSRAEGFGLPMAEAMLSGLAVITTGWGGQLDFCNAETAWLIDYIFEKSDSHFGLFDSMWAAPSVEHLASIMLEVYQMPWDLRIMRSENGKRLLLASFSWAHVAGRLVNSAYSFSRTFINLQPRFGFVTTWHTRCGIATYSEHLISNTLNSSTIFAAKGHQLNEIDSSNVVRCWTQGEDDSLDELINNIREQRIDAIVIQFNYGFFNFEKFNIFLHRLLTDGCVVVVTLHSTTDPLHIPNKCLKDLRLSLSLCHRLLVHTLDDLNRLKAIGLIENVTLFPHGIPSYEPPSNTNFRGRGIGASSGDLIVASYGFFLPHKGLLELIDAIYILNMSGRIFQLYMINAEYPAPESAVLIQTARDKISQLGLNEVIKMTTDYLPDEESLSLLAKADLIVFPYQNTGESSSAAVRYGIASGRPVAVTPLSIFGDVSHLVYQLPGQTPQDIATGIRQVLHEIASDSDSLTARAATKKRWRETHSYIALGRRLDGMLQALVRQRQRKIDSSGGSDAHNKPSQVLNSMGHSSRF